MRTKVPVLIAIIVLFALAGTVHAQDIHEPNDQIGDAYSFCAYFNQTFNGSIFPAGEVDFYSFYVDTPGIMEIKLEDVPSEMRARIELYGKNFNYITRKDASNPGDTLTFTQDIAGPGWHYIKIYDLAGKAHVEDYTFTFTFAPTEDLNEPNGEIGDASELEIDQTVYSYICPAGDVDFYKIYVNSSGIMEIKLEDVPSEMRARIELYGKNFNYITRKDASNAGDPLTFTQDIAGPGWHYIKIYDLAGKAHADEYNVTFSFDPAADLNEPNNEIGDAIEIEFNQTASSYICPAGDIDLYKFYVDSSGIMEIKLEEVPSETRARVELYGKNFNYITRKDASNAGDTLTFTQDIAGPGWYYVRISDLEGKAHTDELNVTFSFEQAEDVNEPNDVVGDATEIDIDQVISGYICPVNDVDYYWFYMDSSGTMQVKLESVSSDMRAKIDLYGKNANWITRKEASNAGDLITLEIDLTEPGWYFIAISDLDRKAHIEEYTFSIRQVEG